MTCEQKLIDILKKKTQAGDMGACCQLGNMYENGLSVRCNYKKAFAYYLKAAEAGNGFALEAVGRFYMQGKVPKDFYLAVKYLKLATECGQFMAYSHLAYLYEKGLGVESNAAEAYRLYELGDKSGDVTAVNHLIRLNYLGVGVEKNYAKAVELFNETEKQHIYNKTYAIISRCYRFGLGVEKSDRLANMYQKLSRSSIEIT
jgi:hypothetical protein